jgi:hypothetical protein
MPTSGPHPYVNVLDASRGLLLDVCKRLNALHTNYVIVGGWVPYLRTKHETLQHPGTKDVDVLLNDDKKLLQLAVQALLDAGYLLSAKHPFQLLKTLKVREGDGARNFVFNVDLMHPSEGAARPDMFAEILELNIAENYDPQKISVKSIIFPSSSIVFTEKMWSDFPLSASYPTGGEGQADIPLLDEVGLLLSKCESATKKKRERDSYDIYYVLTAQNGAAVAAALRSASKRFPQVSDQLNLLKDFLLRDGGSRFESNVMRYIAYEKISNRHPADDVMKLLFD